MSISERLNQVKHLINEREILFHRQTGDVQLIAVSKGHPSTSIKEAYHAGQRDFAENYYQEAQDKIEALSSFPLCWHFIGPIQSNKAKGIASLFSWVHSLCRLNIAKQLNEARPDNLPPLNICLQVNLDQEPTKSGIEPQHVAELAAYVLQCNRLQLRGLMCIPKQQPNEDLQYLSLLRLKNLLDTLNNQLNLRMDTLSMGMSQDISAAIHAGSTMLRIGTAIFGERKGGPHEH